MKRALVLLALLLGACTEYPEKTTRVEVTVEERNDAKEYCSELMKRRVSACAIMNPVELGGKRNICRIVITPNDANGSLALLGEEFLHCMTGQWHK